MVTLKRDETNRELGKKPQVCRICGAGGDFDTYLVREMMQGTGEEFPYFVCGRGHCLQIATVPENLGDYYGRDYYSFQIPEETGMEFEVPVHNSRKILDVGCGGGVWLVQKAMEGWGNLYGCDPFLEKGRQYGQRVTIRNCSIHDMEGDGTFDIIHMSDSFEHMADPLEVLRSAHRLLKQSGILYMTIPTYPNIAFERFGSHWYQLDAPRHIFLHSRESIEQLARNSGMIVTDIKYNADESQFIRSFFYQHGVPFFQQDKLIGRYFTSAEREKLKKESVIWNEKEYGDHMEVYWQKGLLPAMGQEKKAVFQKFSGEGSRRLSPYPPVYRERNTDYICFTDNIGVCSSDWEIIQVENVEQADIDTYLEGYGFRWELQPNQIQMGPLFENRGEENIVTILGLNELPLVKIDLENFMPTSDHEGNYLYRKNPIYNKGKYKGRPLLLTIGVPVSNQIGTIGRCLSKIKPLLDGLDAELLVVDTGSTDGTVEVCKSYGARIVSKPWCDNMSLVRNEGIFHAKGLWYMSIDDDEWFEDVDDILQFFQKGIYKNYNMATYIQRNYRDSEGKIFEDHHTTRMAEITPELHFEGRIHDAIIIHGNMKSYMLRSYAHHYGFVNDRPEQVKEKFIRNATILLQDVYEYPKDLRYLFQLANEYSCIQSNDVALALFAQTIALAKEAENNYRGNISVIKLLDCLYAADDTRLFSWGQYLKDSFPLTVAEQAGIAWSQEILAFQLGKPAGQVLAFYSSYHQMLNQYKEDPGASWYLTFHGLAKVEHDFFIMEAKAVAFCAYLKVGEEEKALKLLQDISLEVVENRCIAIFAAAFASGDDIYGELCAKLTPMQWEEWSGQILDVFAFCLAREGSGSRQVKRFPDILSRISVPSVISWAEESREKRRGKIGERLFTYAMECTLGNNPVQELCLCAWLLKEAYVKKRSAGREKEPTFCIVPKAAVITEQEEPGSREVLYQYISFLGAFAQEYYNPGYLMDPGSCVVPPDIRAAWRMAAVLAEGRATSENVALLKQALEIFPSFHEEIRTILKGLQH